VRPEFLLIDVGALLQQSHTDNHDLPPALLIS